MIFKEAMRKVESHEFAAYLNIASDIRTFLRAAQQEEAVLTLLKDLDSLENCWQILIRIFELSRQQIDLRYENQWDTALAIYVWLINLKDFDLAKIAAFVADRAPQCWWAKKISRHILLGEQVYNNAGFEQYKFTPSSAILDTVNQISNAGESCLPISFLSGIAEITEIEPDVVIRLSGVAEPVTTQKWSQASSAYEILLHTTESNVVVG
jgi:hypothetical protein